MTQELFRREALEAKRMQAFGGISLAQPLRLWLLTGSAAFAAVAIVLFLVLGSYTRRSNVTGRLVPSAGLVAVPAPANGVLGPLEVGEGGRVAAGQPLVVVTVPRILQGSGDAVAALERRLQERQEGLESAQQAQRERLEAQAEGLHVQLGVARHELAQAEAEVATRQEQIRIAGETLERLRSLQKGQYVSALQIKQQESTVLEYTSQKQVLQRQAIATRRTIAQIEQALRELPGQREATDAGYRSELAQLEQERVQTRASGALVVTAPVDGVIATQTVKAGQAVQAGQPLMSLLPGKGELEAELLVPSQAIGFLAPGDSVQLRYHAFPYQKFGHHEGRVASISRSALSTGELGALIGSVQQGEPFYRVTVALDRQTVMAYGQAEPLKPGMLLEAGILGERRKLIEWVFEPLYSLKERVGGG